MNHPAALSSVQAWGLTFRACSRRAPPDGPADVILRMDRVPAPPEGTRVASDDPRREVRLQVPDAGCVAVRDGQTVAVDPREGDASRLHVTLAGTVPGILFHQRGRLVLHGTAVRIKGRTAVLVGPSGTGKSTLAAALLGRGGTLVTEDVAPIYTEDETPRVHPVCQQLRLWPDAAQAVGLNALQPLHSGTEKGVVEPAEEGPARPVALDAVFVLTNGAKLEVTPLPPRERVLTLLCLSYCRSLLNGGNVRHFRQCGTLAETVPLRRLRVPEALDRLGEVARAVETALDRL